LREKLITLLLAYHKKKHCNVKKGGKWLQKGRKERKIQKESKVKIS